MSKKIAQSTDEIAGWLTRHEGQFLTEAARITGRLAGETVEIGSYVGKSTIWLTKGAKRVVSIDPHKGEVSGGKTAPTYKQFIENLTRAGVRQAVTAIVKTSKQASRGWNKPIVFLFIDGLHDYEHSHEDYSLWSPFLVDGGIVAMHDAFCGWEGAGRVAMRDIVYGGDFREIGVVGSIIYGVKGNPEFVESVNIMRTQVAIEICQFLYRMRLLPQKLRFVLVHRMLRMLLINRFTSFA